MFMGHATLDTAVTAAPPPATRAPSALDVEVMVASSGRAAGSL
jgi:hypothetical protein